MRVALDLFGIFFFLAGVGTYFLTIGPTSSVSGLLLILIGAVFLVGGAIVHAIERLQE